MSLFSRLSENRFPKDRGLSNIGPGSYEVPTCLDEKGVLIREGRDRFEEASEASFSIFIDEVDPDRPVRTPRGIRASTKENIVVGSSSRARSKSLGTRSEPGDEKAKIEDVSIIKKNLTATNAKLQAKDRSISELQKRVEELESEGRDAQNTILGLRAKKEEYERALEAAKKQPDDPLALDNEALLAMVRDLVDQHLETPRQVLCLQRQVWEREAAKMQEEAEILERKVEKSKERHRKIEERNQERLHKMEEENQERHRKMDEEAECLRAALQTETRKATETTKELEAAHQEVSSANQSLVAKDEELEAVHQELSGANQSLAAKDEALEVSQLEQQRLLEKLAASEDEIQRLREREATMAGHMNHKQKIRITFDLKKENNSLKEEVQRLRQQLLQRERVKCECQPVASKSSSSDNKSSARPLRRQLLSQPEEVLGELATEPLEPSMADAIAKEAEIQTARRMK